MKISLSHNKLFTNDEQDYLNYHLNNSDFGGTFQLFVIDMFMDHNQMMISYIKKIISYS